MVWFAIVSVMSFTALMHCINLEVSNDGFRETTQVATGRGDLNIVLPHIHICEVIHPQFKVSKRNRQKKYDIQVLLHLKRSLNS